MSPVSSVEIRIVELVVDQNSNMPVILLRVVDRDLVFPFWVGIFEANAISLVMQGVVAERPMTHDLLKDMVLAMNGTVSRVAMTDFREQTFFATIYVRVAGKEIEVDSRPSDAFSLAIRFGAPMYISEELLDSVDAYASLEAAVQSLQQTDETP